MTGNLESYLRVSSKLKLGTFEDEYTENINSVSAKPQQSTGDTEAAAQVKTCEQYELVFCPIWLAIFPPRFLLQKSKEIFLYIFSFHPSQHSPQKLNLL